MVPGTHSNSEKAIMKMCLSHYVLRFSGGEEAYGGHVEPKYLISGKRAGVD